MPRTMLAQLAMQTGDRAAAAAYASAALPVMRRLGASDDEIQVRSLLVLCAIADGRLADAAQELDRVEGVGEVTAVFGAGGMRQVCRAELALASGDHAAGLQLHRECAARMRALRIPGVPWTGAEPWVLFGDSVALSAHARYAAADDDTAHGSALFRMCRDDVVRVADLLGSQLDYPATGQLLLALGIWGLLRRAAPLDVSLRLLALADRFAYNRTLPTMMWERIAAEAEEAAPGQLNEFRARYQACQPADLIAEARRLAELLPG